MNVLKTLVSPTTTKGFPVPTLGGGHEISQTPTSQLSFEPKSIGCVSFTVKAAIVFLVYIFNEELLKRVT